MGCGRDDKLIKSCARGDKNNRASDYGQKSAFFLALFSFCSFSSRNSLSLEQEHINYGGKNLASSSGNQILAPRRRICSKTTELDSPLSLSLSLSLCPSQFLDIYGELVFARRWKSRRGGEKGGWPRGGRRRERRQRSWRRFVAVAGDRLLLILSAELQSCRLPRSLFPIFYGSGCSLTVRRFYL